MRFPTWVARSVAALIAIGALAGGLAATANARAAKASPLAGLAAPAAPVLAHGVASIANGTITASVMPDLETVGETGQVTTVATAPVDASGWYELRADPGRGAMASALAKAIARNNGWVNLDLTTIGADGTMMLQSISRQFVHGQWVGGDQSNEVKEAAQAHVLLRRALPPGRRFQSGGPGDPCLANESISLVDTGVTYVTNGELHTGDNQWGNFYYGQTADSDLEVGIQQPLGGSWSVSGTAHVGNSAGAFAQWNVGSQWGYKLRTQMHFLKYRYSFPHSIPCPADYYKTVADRWDGGNVLGESVHDLDNNCRNYPQGQRIAVYKGSSWGRISYNFTWFSGAFSAFGFSARAQSGASQYVRSSWTVGQNYTYYYYCGSDDSPFYAHRVYAGW